VFTKHGDECVHHDISFDEVGGSYIKEEVHHLFLLGSKVHLGGISVDDWWHGEDCPGGCLRQILWCSFSWRSMMEL